MFSRMIKEQFCVNRVFWVPQPKLFFFSTKIDLIQPKSYASHLKIDFSHLVFLTKCKID
jgi:hypothetical protein